MSAKTIKNEIRFLPSAIELLLFPTKKPYEVFVDDYNNNTKSQDRFIDYHIEGCADTLWAKQAMAEHLMDKYCLTRRDSTYYDTVYWVSVLDDSKLVYVDEDCPFTDHNFYRPTDKPHYNDLLCVHWGEVCYYLLWCGLDLDTNTVEYNFRDGRYDFRVPVEAYRRGGMPEYQRVLRDSLGIG